MSKYENTIMNDRLNAYRNMVFDANIEEKPEDIFLAIKYEDHGDEFLYIKTKDNKAYEYGFYCNRHGWEDYKNLDRSNEYIRKPMMNVEKTDENASVSNKLFFALERQFKKDHMSFDFDKICYSKEEAERCFERGLEAFEEAKKSNTFYNYEDYYKEIHYFLERNEINTEENIQKLNNAPLSSKVNGVDGVSGKIDKTDKVMLSGDTCIYVFVNGEEIDLSTLAYTNGEYDEWGCCTHYLPLDQFDSDIEVKKRNECIERIHFIKDALNDCLDKLCNTDDIKELVSIKDSLDDIECDMWRLM